MRQIFSALVLLTIGLLASCKKNDLDSIVETHYKYRNKTFYNIDINVYRKSNSLVQFNYTIKPEDSLELDFRNVDAFAEPFGAPEVDSAEVIFAGSKKLIYTLDGPNGFSVPRNIFNRNDPAYTQSMYSDKRYNCTYNFTNTDYFNAK